MRKLGDWRRQYENVKHGCPGLSGKFASEYDWNKFGSNASRVHFLDRVDGMVSVPRSKMVKPEELKLEQAASLPQGATVAVIEGEFRGHPT